MHRFGFRTAVTNAINGYARKRGMLRSPTGRLSTDESWRLPRWFRSSFRSPQFEGQTKTKLGNARVRSIVYGLVNERLEFFLEENPKFARAIVEKTMQAQRGPRCGEESARPVAPQERPEGSGLPGKLVDCKNTNPAESELFLVEGDSAGGTAKAAANPNTQAICRCAVRSSTSRKPPDKVLSNEEIGP